MKKNPMVYGELLRSPIRPPANMCLAGIPYNEVADDPQLGAKREQLVKTAARKLASARMIHYDERSGDFTITDLGRIAAKYYIRHATIEIFNAEFKKVMSEADVLAVLSMSTEVRSNW